MSYFDTERQQAFGVDLSRYNVSADLCHYPNFDELAVHKPQLHFIGLRTGQSWADKDPAFAVLVREAMRIGLCVLPYHVIYPGEPALKQVDFMLKLLEGIPLAFGLEGLANRLRALYRNPDDPGVEVMGPWVEDLSSQASYGVHEKLLRLGVCRAESAAELVTAELKTHAWPAAAIEVVRGGKGWKMEARGWLESLRWRNVDLDNSLAGQLDPATGTVGLQDCLALIFGHCGTAMNGWKLLPGNERRLPWPGWPLGDGLSQLKKLVRLIAAGGEHLTVHVDTSNFVSLEVQEPSPAEIVGQIAADGIAYDLQGRALAEGTYPVGGYWRWGGAAMWVDKLCWEKGVLRLQS